MNNILILLILFSFQTNAQKKPYPRLKENKEWVYNLKTIQSKTKKIELIKAKIYSDTLYENLNLRIRFDGPRGPEYICKTLLIIEIENKHYQLDLYKYPKLTKIMAYINDKNINEIKFLDEETAGAYYGEQGLCGVVIMSCNKKLARKFRNIL